MNFSNLNKIFEDKFTISKKLLREEASLKSKKEKSKKKLTESIDRNLTERDWKLTIPGSFRDDMLNAGEEEDFDKVKNILIDMCNYVLEHIDESNFDLDDQEYVIEEFEDFIEELEYVDFEDEDEANYYLNDLYDLLDNTDIFLGLRESLNEEKSELTKVDILNWLAEHDQAYDDAEKFFKGNLTGTSVEDLKAWISDHNQLASDFEGYFNCSLDESLNEEKITGGNMEQEDINLIEPLIDFFDELESNYKDVCMGITWNFGRRKSDNKMTAGVDVYLKGDFDNEDSEDYWLKKDEELLDRIRDYLPDYGFRFDDSLGYDKDPWKEHMFGDGYHTQIIEDVIEESLNESNEEKPSKEQFIAYCIIQHSGITNMFNVDKVIEASDYVLDIPLTKENILYIYSHYSELLDEYHGFNPNMFKSEIYDVRDSYGMSTDDYDESLNESWVLFFDEDGINHAGSDGAHKFNLSPKIIERKIKSSDYHLPNWAESYIILSDSQFHKMDYDEIEKYHKRYGKTLNEDTVKQDGKWVNKGKEGTHGKFKTKKEADAQRKAMFANGFHENLTETLYNGTTEEELEEQKIKANQLSKDILYLVDLFSGPYKLSSDLTHSDIIGLKTAAEILQEFSSK